MNFTEFTAGPDDNERRFDRVVKKVLSLKSPNLNQSVFALMRKGFVKLNGKKADGNDRVHEGDIISFADFLFAGGTEISSSGNDDSSQNNTPSVSLETIFRNEYIWFINKPYGIPVQPSSADGISLSRIVEDEYKASSGTKSLSFMPGPLHRLDRNTTGLVAFSQNLEGAQWFSKTISSDGTEGTDPCSKGTDPSLTKEITKTYIGLVQGTLEEEQLWTDYIDQTPPPVTGNSAGTFKTVKTYAAETENALKAVTKAIPLAHGSHNGTKLTLVQFTILTGRKHQIRACSSFHKYPLYGDRAYGGKKLLIPCSNIEYFLHAARLDFKKDNPIGLPQFLEAPLPKEFSTFLSQNLIKWNGRLIIK